MKSFLPQFTVATLSMEVPRLRSKIGGIPWGFPREQWPHCCDAPQKLLAQICHEPPAIDLGGNDFVLYLFQCLECCGIGDRGRNAFLLKRDDLVDHSVTVPEYDKTPELGEPLIGEIFISGWNAVEDGIPESRLPDFFSEEYRYWSLQGDYPEIEWFDHNSRFGGSPRWTGNGPQGPPTAPFEFLFQLSTLLYISGNPPRADQIGCSINTEGSTFNTQSQMRTKPNAPWSVFHSPKLDHHAVEFTNLGSDGTLYVFIDRTKSPPKAQWYWNR